MHVDAGSFAAGLAELSIDVANASAGALGDPEQRVRGGEVLTHDTVSEGPFDDVARRCFLDAHLAGLPAAFATSAPTVEGDPIVTVWLTGTDACRNGSTAPATRSAAARSTRRPARLPRTDHTDT